MALGEGLDAESDAVGPGIYGGRVERDARGALVIGQQYEQHNPLPGPVYAGGGYARCSDPLPPPQPQPEPPLSSGIPR